MFHLFLTFAKFSRIFALLLSPQRLATLTLALLLCSVCAGCSCEDPKVKYQQLLEKAKVFAEKEDHQAARVTLLSAVELQPQEAEGYYRLAEAQIRLQQVGPAVENYNTAINYNAKHREARLHLAAILLAAREYELAESHVQKLLEQNPKDAEVLVLQANLESGGVRKNFGRAREILKQVLEAEPKNVAAIASMGYVCLNDGEVKEAEDYFLKASQLEPANQQLRMALADLYSRQGRLDEAQAILEELVKLAPQQSSLNYIFGEFLLRRGLSEQALEQYEKTISVDPTRHLARDRLYDMYLTRKELEKAKALTTSLAEKLPENPGVHYFKGRDLELESKIEEALASYIEAIKTLGSFAPAFRRAGLIEMLTGKTREGVEHLQQAIAMDGDDVVARLTLARHYYVNRELSQATEQVEQVLARFPRQLGANLLRADIALVEGKTEKAREVYEFFVKAFPKVQDGYFKMGLLEESSNNPEKAAEWYRKVLEFDRNIFVALRRYALLRAKKQGVDNAIVDLKEMQSKSTESKGEYSLMLGTLEMMNQSNPQRLQSARAHFTSAIEQNPKLTGAYVGLGVIDSQEGDLDSAAANYQKLLQKNPKHIPSHMLLAMTRERQGNVKGAAEAYQNILDFAPNFAPAANNLAYLLAEELNGDLDQALKLAQSAKESLSNDPSVTDTLGWVHFKRGSARVALPILEDAVQMERDAGGGKEAPNPEILYHLASTKLALEDKAGAQRAIDEALQILGSSQHPKRAAMEELQKNTR